MKYQTLYHDYMKSYDNFQKTIKKFSKIYKEDDFSRFVKRCPSCGTPVKIEISEDNVSSNGEILSFYHQKEVCFKCALDDFIPYNRYGFFHLSNFFQAISYYENDNYNNSSLYVFYLFKNKMGYSPFYTGEGNKIIVKKISAFFIGG